MAVTQAKGKLRGKMPKLSEERQKELHRMRDTGEHPISDLAEIFSVSRPTIHRSLVRAPAVDLGNEPKTMGMHAK